MFCSQDQSNAALITAHPNPSWMIVTALSSIHFDLSLSAFFFFVFLLTLPSLSLAVEDYQEAREFDMENNEIREGLERAQKLLKLSRKRDYYKILGVNRYD